MQRGFQGAPHPPRTCSPPRSVVSLCTPNSSLSSTGPGSSHACPRAALSAASSLCIQPSHKQLSCREAPTSPILGGSGYLGGAEPHSPLPPKEWGLLPSGCPPRHVHPLLAAGARAGRDLSAQGSPSSPFTQLFLGTSMAVTLSERVYNPAPALGSLGRAGGRLSSRGCRSAGARCCQRPDAGVSHTLRYPWDCLDHRNVHPHGEGAPAPRAGGGAQGLFLCLRSGKRRDRCPRHPPRHWLCYPTCEGVE